MKYKEYKSALRMDREMCGVRSHFKLYMINSGYKIVTHYRRCELYRENKLLYPLYMYQRYLYNRKCVKYGCDIPSHAKIGAGFKIDHPVGVVINSKAIIGERVNIKCGAVIGKTQKGVPQIGNGVMIGAHALILGNIKIGDNAEIGAGAIVTHDVPKNAVVTNDAAAIRRLKEDGLQ